MDPGRTYSLPPPGPDWGRAVARLLCLLFGVLGALPLGAGFFIGSETARNWMSAETSRILASELALRASYEVSMTLLPLEIKLTDVRVDSVDGGDPALSAAEVRIAPRIFALIGGRLDIGEIELDGAEIRLVVQDGEVVNVRPKLPEDDSEEQGLPFQVLSLSDARLDLSWEGSRLRTGTVDADLFVERNGHLELALRVGETWVETLNSVWTETAEPGIEPWDGDVVCQLDARVRIAPDEVLVRRLSAMGTIDVDPAPGTRPDCKTSKEEAPPGRFAFRADQLEITPGEGEARVGLVGNIFARVPVDIVNRLGPPETPFRGWVALSGDVRWYERNRLPDFSGQVKSGELWYGRNRILEHLDGQIEVIGDEVFSPELTIGYGGGVVQAWDSEFDPFADGMPLRTRRVLIQDVLFSNLMRDTDVTEDSIVQFTIDDTVVSEFQGTLSPLDLDGGLDAQAVDFRLYDRSFRDPQRTKMLGIEGRTHVAGSFGLRSEGLHFDNETVSFGNSVLRATVRVGFSNWIELEEKDGTLDLADISPLVGVPMSGIAAIGATMSGPRSDPALKGTLAVEDLVFGGFPIGDVLPTEVRFRPLRVEIEGGGIQKGRSTFELPTGSFDFETGADVLFDAAVKSHHADVRDFMSMWNFEQDPRWTDVTGRVDLDGHFRYVRGGKQDPCGGGRLTAGGAATLQSPAFIGEAFDNGAAEFELDWTDMAAGYRGLNLDVTSYELRKGPGSVLGSLRISTGAKIRGTVSANSLPLSRLDALGALGDLVSGTLSAQGTLAGTTDEMTGAFSVRVSEVIVGRSRLAPSKLGVLMEAVPVEPSAAERTRCGQPLPTPFDPEKYAMDVPQGRFVVNGSLFGEAIRVKGATISRARGKVASGELELHDLPLEPLFQLQPDIALATSVPTGTLSGQVRIAQWPLDDWTRSVVAADLTALSVKWKGFGWRPLSNPHIELGKRRLAVQPFALEMSSPEGYTTTFDVAGAIDEIADRKVADIALSMRPVRLSQFVALFEADSETDGTLGGEVRLLGPLSQLRQEGGFQLRDGRFSIPDTSLQATNASLDLVLEEGSLSVRQASAEIGGGTLTAAGSAPLVGLKLGAFRGQLQARDVDLPVIAGVSMAVDADLEGTWFPQESEEVRLPKISGQLKLRSLEYTRPVTMNADISALAGRGQKTKFESYDPSNDQVQFDVLISSEGPLRISNNLIETRLKVDKPGLHLTGTNQRYGLRGRVQLEPGGRMQLRRSQFDIRSGEIRFDDPTKIAPRVDVTAVTEYRRFSNTTATGSSGGSAPTSGASNAGSAAGQWRITMHAYGDSENLKLDLSSQPELSQDDIFLLLTLGLTRAELDQANLQGGVALEALGSLTGADAAVTDAIPVIDEFRFGSSYSTRTGRSEPTVTVGKRLTQRIRAFVTSGLNESREVRSNLEWRLNPRTSIEGSYDNINDISSSSVGNIGADVRWRLEFD